MYPLMEAQPTAIPEAFPTLRAQIRLLACVDADVARERPRVSETCGALCASIWLLACMDPLMDLEVVHAVKVSAAL